MVAWVGDHVVKRNIYEDRWSLESLRRGERVGGDTYGWTKADDRYRILFWVERLGS
jgi:hypothetical protein